jgi:hypothetical protein
VLNSFAKHNLVCALVDSCCANIVYIQETKMEKIYIRTLLSMLGPNFANHIELLFGWENWACSWVGNFWAI